MTATNHALTGAAIGLIVGEPLIAIPASFASHFVCDALPHFAFSDRQKVLGTNLFRNYLVTEAIVCLMIVGLLFYLHPHNWLLAAACAFVAASPDFLWINKFRYARKNQQWRPDVFARFAGGIQWFQKPIGAVVEIVWFVSLIAIIAPFLR
jgi:hypothetical protein